MYVMGKSLVTKLKSHPNKTDVSFLPLPKKMIDIIKCEEGGEVFLLYHQKGSFTLTKKNK